MIEGVFCDFRSIFVVVKFWEKIICKFFLFEHKKKFTDLQKRDHLTTSKSPSYNRTQIKNQTYNYTQQASQESGLTRFYNDETKSHHSYVINEQK